MGLATSKKDNIVWDGDVGNIQDNFKSNCSIPIEILVAHFTPTSFPLFPVISTTTSKICQDSWNLIVEKESIDEFGNKTSGITGFYREFYDRLEVLDSGGRFEAVLGRHTSGDNKIAAKGAILIRIIQFVLQIEKDSKEVQFTLYMLGKSHSQKGIRPWQYTTFLQTLLQTIASRLGVNATNVVMEAWVHTFAFVMKSMLPLAIRGNVVETELHVNTSSEFASGKLAEEVANVEEVREVRKKFKSVSSRGSYAGAESSDGDSVYSHDIHSHSSRLVLPNSSRIDEQLISPLSGRAVPPRKGTVPGLKF